MFEELSSLPDSEIIERLGTHIKREREETEQVIRHFAEVESRRIITGLGYSSLRDYLTRGCGYSEASAWRRINAARTVQRLPEAMDCLKKGELNLSTVEVLASALGKGKDKEVLESVRGKTYEEAKKAVSVFNPVPPNVLREQITTVVVASKADENQGLLKFEDSAKTDENNIYFRSNATTPPEQRHLINFAVDDGFMALLNRAKKLSYRGKKEDLHLETVLRKALEAYISKNDPKEREARRAARRIARSERSSKREAAAARKLQTKTEPAGKASKEPRAIPAAVRDAVLCRDGHCCTFVGANGNRCQSRYDLEVDHIVPRALGGKSTVEDLRTLCASHNLHAARVFGTKYVDARIAFESGRRNAPQ